MLQGWLFVGLVAGLLIGLIGGIFGELLVRLLGNPAGRLVGGLFIGLIIGMSEVLIRWLYIRLIGWLLGWLFIGMLGGLFGGLFGGLAIGFVIGFLRWLNKLVPYIWTTENVNWSWGLFAKGIASINNLILLTITMVGFLIAGQFKWLFAEPPVWIFIGMFLVLSLSILSGLFEILGSSKDIIQITSPYHRFNASMKVLHFSILQHRFLRYQLRRKGLLPPDLVAFLNGMSQRHILEFDGDPATGQGGGTWRFRHRILQEYFAGKRVEE